MMYAKNFEMVYSVTNLRTRQIFAPNNDTYRTGGRITTLYIIVSVRHAKYDGCKKRGRLRN